MIPGALPHLAKRTHAVAVLLLLGLLAWSQADGVGSRVAAPTVPPSGWCDVPCENGRAVITGGLSDHDGETILIVSAFGPAQQPTTVIVRTITSASATRPLVWKPLTRAQRGDGLQPVQDTVLSTSPVSWMTDESRVRRVFLARPGCRGADPADYDVVECTPVVRSGRCAIWRDAAVAWSDDLAVWAEQVAGIIEQSLPAVERCQGPIADIDQSGGVTIVVTPRVATYSQSEPALCAFVRPTDFRPGLDRPWSNRGDLVYLQPGTPVETLRPVLTHELTHLAQLSWCRDTFDAEPWPMPEWIAEAVAHATELQLTGSDDNVASRLAMFFARPEHCPLVMCESASAQWRDPGSRGATCAFGVWCAEQYGPRWWQAWMDADPAFDDRWSALGEESFAEVYRQWTIALCDNRSAMTLSDVIDIETVILRGTSSKYFRWDALSSDVIVEAPAEAAVQLTLVRRTPGDDGHHARMSVTTSPATSVSR